MAILAPSILSADFWNLGQDVAAAEQGGAHWLHVDVMDGHYVPNITIGPLVVRAIQGRTRLPIDVHLMIENADLYISDFADAGADNITVHVEACRHLHRTLDLIREEGDRVGRKITAGVSLNPLTPLSSIADALPFIDLILLMSVNPGFGGQKFIPEVLSKLDDLRSLLLTRQTRALVEMDGGLGLNNVAEVVARGVDVVVAGSAVFGKGDPAKNCRELCEAMNVLS